jgi:3-deoxy-7-phosphoheptulonate synthase
MVIKLYANSTPEQRMHILATVAKLGYKTYEITTQTAQYIVGTGKTEYDIRHIGHLDGVEDIHHVSDTYKLVSSSWKVGRTKLNVGNGVTLGAADLTIMAGPCSIESEAQIENRLKNITKV